MFKTKTWEIFSAFNLYVEVGFFLFQIRKTTGGLLPVALASKSNMATGLVIAKVMSYY